MWRFRHRARCASRVGEALAQPLSLGEGELVMTVSTGIAMASSPLISAETLLRDADAIVSLSRALNLRTVAEGVETPLTDAAAHRSGQEIAAG